MDLFFNIFRSFFFAAACVGLLCFPLVFGMSQLTHAPSASIATSIATTSAVNSASLGTASSALSVYHLLLMATPVFAFAGGGAWALKKKHDEAARQQKIKTDKEQDLQKLKQREAMQLLEKQAVMRKAAQEARLKNLERELAQKNKTLSKFSSEVTSLMKNHAASQRIGRLEMANKKLKSQHKQLESNQDNKASIDAEKISSQRESVDNDKLAKKVVPVVIPSKKNKLSGSQPSSATKVAPRGKSAFGGDDEDVFEATANKLKKKPQKSEENFDEEVQKRIQKHLVPYEQAIQNLNGQVQQLGGQLQSFQEEENSEPAANRMLREAEHEEDIVTLFDPVYGPDLLANAATAVVDARDAWAEAERNNNNASTHQTRGDLADAKRTFEKKTIRLAKLKKLDSERRKLPKALQYDLLAASDNKNMVGYNWGKGTYNGKTNWGRKLGPLYDIKTGKARRLKGGVKRHRWWREKLPGLSVRKDDDDTPPDIPALEKGRWYKPWTWPRK